MKPTTATVAGAASAALLATAPFAAASSHHGHQHLHKLMHEHHHQETSDKGHGNPRYNGKNTSELKARGAATCQFPQDEGLVAITSNLLNGGWALSPDMECVAGEWCPIACPPGQVMNQWKPGSTYSVPESTYGGVYCNENGEIEVPFEDSPFCVDGTGNVEVVNECGDVVSFCQTVLPGYEDMIIPTEVTSTATLAVPDISYWQGTAAHYYVSPPGTGAADACVWGDVSQPKGNWAPYVAGANTVEDGSTYLQLSVNPIWTEAKDSFGPPTFGLEIVCDNCNGMPCRVDDKGITSSSKASGADATEFCVVTVPSGSSAQIRAYNLDGSAGEPEPSPSPEPEPEPETTSTPTPTPTPEPTTSSTSSETTSTTPTPSSSSTSSSSTPSPTPSTTSSVSSSSKSSKTASATPTSSKPADRFGAFGGIFQENGTTTKTSTTKSPGSSSTPVPVGNNSDEDADSEGASSPGSDSNESTTDETGSNEASGNDRGSAALGSLIVALVAAAYLF